MKSHWKNYDAGDSFSQQKSCSQIFNFSETGQMKKTPQKNLV